MKILSKEYKNIKEKLLKGESITKEEITSLSLDSKKDLVTSLPLFNSDTILKLFTIEPKIFKPAIINNQEVINIIVNDNDLVNILNNHKFKEKDYHTILKNLTNYNNSKVLYDLIKEIKLTNRENIYNKEMLLSLYKNNTYELDIYSINYILIRKNILDKLTNEELLRLIINSNIIYTNELIKDDNIIIRIFKVKDKSLLVELLKNKKEYLKIFSYDLIYKYYNKDLLNNILLYLNPDEKINLVNNKLLKEVLKDEELIKIYKKLYNENPYLLNTLDFNILCEDIKGIKISNLSKIVKYPIIQKIILEINKKTKIIPLFIDKLISNTNNLDINTIIEILNIINKTNNGIDRKIYGNILKLAPTNLDKTTTKEFNKLINYILYLIPRYNNIDRNIYLKTPKNYQDISEYENNLNNYLKEEIKNKNNILDNFLFRHFKVNKNEAIYLTKLYSIDRIDSNIYKEEITFIKNITMILNTDIDSLIKIDNKYKVITMLDNYILINKINKMYSRIYNYEIKNPIYSIKPTIKKVYGKEIKIYKCPLDFKFLVSRVDITEEYLHTGSYLLGWYYTLNKLNTIKTSLISNDNLAIDSDIIFCFDSLEETSIKSISPYLNKKKYTYMSPRELIDNTRDINNTIELDKYYLNNKIPYIIPNFILVNKNKLNDNAFLEKISRISNEFKTKDNKEGLPIVEIDYKLIINNEIDKLNKIALKYQKNHDMKLLSTLITKLENNYTSYHLFNESYSKYFDIDILISIINDRIDNTNSISELNYIENILEQEQSKYKYLKEDLLSNIDLPNILNKINNKRIILEKT